MRFIVIFALWGSTLCAADHFLTFIIPCYNCEKWVEEAIASIYEQKNLSCPFEIICTDDGSKDSTYAKLSSLRVHHPELRVFQHVKNRGGGACRNNCVAHAQGDLIFCLDADNVLVPNSVQTLIDRLDQSGDEIVSFGALRYFTDDEVPLVIGLCTYQSPDNRYTLQQILQNPDSPPWSGNYLYTKESFVKVGGYPEKVSAMDTFAFGFLQLFHGCKMSYVPGTYYLHRHGIDSYYVRESANRKLTKIFCTFLLDHRDIFDRKVVKLLQRELAHAQKGEPGKDQIALLMEKKLLLK